MIILLNLLIFILGLCIGSFLNCAIYRLEHKKSMKGRSFCPRCKHTLRWKDLFPVFSFLLLGGKCRYCKKAISLQYPIIELSSGLIFLMILNLVTGFVPTAYGILSLIFYCAISCFLIIIFAYDLRHYIIPDKVLLPAIFIALAYRLLFLSQSPYLFSNYLLAALVASGFFFLIFFVSGGKWMGFGDVKLCILLGLLLGLQNTLLALFLAFLFGAIIGVIMMVFYKKGLKSEIPFGPFLITGAFIAMFWGSQVMQWYLQLFRI